MNRHDSLTSISKYITNKDNPIYYIVRNPFTQIYSWFWHCVRFGKINNFKNELSIKYFENFVKTQLKNDRFMVPYNKYIDSTTYKNLKVFKFEDGFDKIIKYINIKHKLNFVNIDKNYNPIKNYKRNRNTIISYYKNEEIVKIIIEYRKFDFIKYGYSFNINDI